MVLINCGRSSDEVFDQEAFNKAMQQLEGPGLSVLAYNVHLFDLAGHFAGIPYQDGTTFEGIIKWIIGLATDDPIIDDDSVRAMLIANRIRDFTTNGPDIIIFEEVWSDAQAMILLNELKYPHFYRPENTNILTPHSGLLLVSKYPFEKGSQKFTDYKDLVDDDSFVSKGLGQATVVISDSEKIGVFFTHTQNITKDPNSGPAQLSNFQQIEQAITNFQNNNPNSGVILGGDLNFSPPTDQKNNDTIRAGLQKIGLIDAWTEFTGKTVDDSSSITNDEDKARLDYIFHNGKGPLKGIKGMPSPADILSDVFSYTGSNDEDRGMSDHYPVWVKFKGMDEN